MWLPETAVDLLTLEELAAEGVEFTILAPHQGEAVGSDGGTGPVDTSMPYRVELPSGRSLAVFFYDTEVSGAVAFGGLLGDPARFVERLVAPPTSGGAGSGAGLHHIATDGETYGHHFSGGERTLARALQSLEAAQDAALSVYGRHLERHPPHRRALIIEGTSWSCRHGVERWRSDCGCAGGREEGYTQGWRTPLRDALDWLRDTTAGRFDEVGGAYLSDPWAARDDYIDLLLMPDDASLEAFLDEHALFPERSRRTAAVERTLGMLEQQRHAMAMFTSCGWFFDDPADIETIQVLQYAGRALQLADAWLDTDSEEAFLERLRGVESNDPEEGDGRSLWARYVRPHLERHPVPRSTD
jgi:alpha-amylase/alpha-mannosidase (GH57 family)